MSTFKMALVQLSVGIDKLANLQRAAHFVEESTRAGAQVVVLPECFNSPYGTNSFESYAEHIDGQTSKALSQMAKESSVYLIGGSFPERDGDKIFNTCTIWNKEGVLIGKHRKMHLFDINVPGKISFKESKVLSAGNEITIVKTEYGSLGIGICYDMRFPEPAMIAARKGCIAMVYPGAFNTITGPIHVIKFKKWELLQRARALDNQIYVAACSPARNESSDYIAWGHSTIVDPMATIIATTNETEGIVYGHICTNVFEAARLNIPVSSQRRFDVYKDIAA